MRQLLRPEQRGHTHIGWLDSHHSFSFGDFYAPDQMGFRQLRVINDDRVAPGRGFGSHGHRDMEILSYVVEGALEHKDSMGNVARIVAGDVQRMSAGTGVVHSEHNGSASEPVHFLQIWLPPAQRGLTPSYEQRHFSREARQGRLRLVASPDGAEGSVSLHQDARLYAGLLSEGDRVLHTLAPGRHAWVQVVGGTVVAGEHRLEEGAGLAVSDEREIELVAASDSEILVFDLS
jgi:redox-sensitive bicupin YhaK (pirin superfamily)